MAEYSTRHHQITRVVTFSAEDIACVAGVDPGEVGELSIHNIRIYKGQLEVSWTVSIEDPVIEAEAEVEGQEALEFGEE